MRTKQLEELADRYLETIDEEICNRCCDEHDEYHWYNEKVVDKTVDRFLKILVAKIEARGR